MKFHALTMNSSNKIPIMISGCFKPKYAERMQGIKDTWLKTLDLDKYFPLFYCFDESNPEDFWDEDAKVLHIAGIDDYNNLSIKSTKCLSFVINKTNATHIWKVDDDTYINCNLFNKYSKFLEYDYLGCPLYLSEGDTRVFMAGAGYCLSRKASEVVCKYIPTYPVSYKDDLCVSKALRENMPDCKIYDESWEVINPFSECNPTKELMIGHWINSSEEMKTMYRFHYNEKA